MQARLGEARLGEARLGEARLGEARLGDANSSNRIYSSISSDGFLMEMILEAFFPHLGMVLREKDIFYGCAGESVNKEMQ